MTSNPKGKLGTKQSGKDNQFAENEYYFTANGLMVFTEAYHLKRGYCCKSGCKHCPYGFKTNTNF